MKFTGLVVQTILCALLFSTASVLAQEMREVKKTVELNKTGEVTIDTYKGSITIETWDKPQVEIYAKIEPDGWDRHDREKVRDTEIRIHDSPEHVSIETDYDALKSHSSWFFGLFGDDEGSLPFVHYTITMPSTARLHIKDYKSESKISDLNASMEMNTYKGKVSIRNFEGSIDLETYKGEIRTDFAKLTGDSRFETYKGSIDITLPKGAGFEFAGDIGRRADFNSDFDLSVKGRHRSAERYSGPVNGGGPLLRVNTEKGVVRLKEK